MASRRTKIKGTTMIWILLLVATIVAPLIILDMYDSNN